MTTSAIVGTGTLLKVGDGGGSEVFTALAEVTGIGDIDISTEMHDATHTSSTWRERIAGMFDAGSIDFECNFLIANATQDASTGLIADQQNKTLRNFQVVFSDGSSTTWALSAFVSRTVVRAPVGDKQTVTFTLTPSGAMTLA